MFQNPNCHCVLSYQIHEQAIWPLDIRLPTLLEGGNKTSGMEIVHFALLITLTAF